MFLSPVPSKVKAFLVLLYTNFASLPSDNNPIFIDPFNFIWLYVFADSSNLIFAFPTLIAVDLSTSGLNTTLYFFNVFSVKPEELIVKSKFRPIFSSTLFSLLPPSASESAETLFPLVASWGVPNPPISIFQVELSKNDEEPLCSVLILAPTDWSPNNFIGVFNCISA